MTKATLIFNLPEEDEDYKIALNGIDYLIALQQFRAFARNWTKGRLKESVEATAKQHETAEHIFETFFNILDERDIKI